MIHPVDKFWKTSLAERNLTFLFPIILDLLAKIEPQHRQRVNNFVCCERDVINILSILCGPLCLHKRWTYSFRMSEAPSKQHQGNKHQISLRGNKAEVPRDAGGAITAHFSSSSFPIFSGAAAADGRLPLCTPKMWRPRSENTGPGIQSRRAFNI